jgi:hypothetical protein
MATQSNVCACAVCLGSECKCGCQTPPARPAASCQYGEACQCGEACRCGEACSCAGGQDAGARQSERR